MTALLYSSPSFTSSTPAATTAAPMAAAAAAIAVPTPATTEPTFSNLPDESSAISPLSESDSAKSSVCSSASSISCPSLSMASSLAFNSDSILFKSACALFSCICQLLVRLSASPKEEEAFSSAACKVCTLFFCASISFVSTPFLALKDWMDLSFLSNCDVTRFISEPSTLKAELISFRAFLNSFSPSTPILTPKLSAIQTPP